jgi:hypothetical protein
MQRMECSSECRHGIRDSVLPVASVFIATAMQRNAFPEIS